ncbi:hypothetical protein SY111_08280 [Ligilactobacillus agilis]|uniref:Uncharacterized protein n=1 Tax=Ligilactobacillus agilis TaxID=1601 RepID=A0A6F9XSD9_9LACO|nr:hypothetical protein [Ligilactobacillus agilis]GET08204.1 hypothetical protein SY111_08280 [Ligilactobacillus agilis]
MNATKNIGLFLLGLGILRTDTLGLVSVYLGSILLIVYLLLSPAYWQLEEQQEQQEQKDSK